MSTVDKSEQQRHREMITTACSKLGLQAPTEWQPDEDDGGREKVPLGRWAAIAENEGEGLYEGDEGELHACVVGAREHGNEHVAYYLTLDGSDSPLGKVYPFEDVEPIG